MSSVQIRDHLPAEVEPIRQFLVANGWAHRIGSPEWFAQLLANSQRTAVAVDGEEIAGFARGITDGLSNGYLSMVVVAPAYRRRGVGSGLVRHIVGDDGDIAWMLKAGRDGAAGFFSRVGFGEAAAAMERPRHRSERPK